MKLDDFLKALKTKDIKITITDNEENEIIRFYSDGYDGVESDIREKEVTKWFLVSASSIRIYIDSSTSDTP